MGDGGMDAEWAEDVISWDPRLSSHQYLSYTVPGI